MKFFFPFALLSTLGFVPTSILGEESSIDFPHVASVTTTRFVASVLSQDLDILRGASRRIGGQGSEQVELNIVLYNEHHVDIIEAARDTLDSQLLLEVNQDLTHRHLQTSGINGTSMDLDLTCYRTVDETYASLETLASQYPDFVTVSKVGDSYLGQEVKIIAITSPSDFANKSDVVLVGGHHSRELPPPEALMRLIEKLLQNYGVDADMTMILDRTTIHVVPIANPDGRAIVEDHLDWWYRKNARPQGCANETMDGVDLNRNYPMFWGLDSGSSNNPCSSAYRGTGPLSESESSSIYSYVRDLFPDEIKRGSTGEEAEARMDEACPIDASGLFIDLHSWGDFIYFPWGYDDVASPNHLPLLTLSAKIAYPGNYSLWGPEQDGFLYFVSGDATDATYGLDCVASVGYEIGLEGFYPDCSAFEEVMIPQVHESLLYALKTASLPYQLPLGPDVLSIEVAMEGMMVTFTVDVSDDAMIVGHAIFEEGTKSQAISQVSVFVDSHPDDGAVGMDMVASDGDFDSVDETAVYTLDMSDMDDGEYTMYFQAMDAAGNVGVVSAIFVTKESNDTISTVPTSMPTATPPTSAPSVSPDSAAASAKLFGVALLVFAALFF